MEITERAELIHIRIAKEEETVMAYQNVILMAKQEIAEAEQRIMLGRLSLVAETIINSYPDAHYILFELLPDGSPEKAIYSIYDTNDIELVGLLAPCVQTE